MLGTTEAQRFTGCCDWRIRRRSVRLKFLSRPEDGVACWAVSGRESSPPMVFCGERAGGFPGAEVMLTQLMKGAERH
jgi:hypothetical protein